MKPISKIVLLTIFFSLLSGTLYSQSWSSGFSLNPRLSLPIANSSNEYKPGIGTELEGFFCHDSLPWLNFGLIAGYQLIPLNLLQEGYIAQTNLSLIDYGLLIKSGITLADRFTLYAAANASAFTAILNGNIYHDAMGFCWGINGGCDFLLNNTFSLQAGVGYTSYLGLHNGFNINIGASARISGPGSPVIPRKSFVPANLIHQPLKGNIEFFDVQINTIFPVLYKYYFDTPVGTATILNNGDDTLSNIKISLSLSQHMDSPKLSGTIIELAPGEKADVELYLLLTSSILSLTEGGKLAGELNADYFVDKRPGKDSRTVVVKSYHRNAMRWDDDQKLATFITSRDEEIQRYARNIASLVRGLEIKGMNAEFQQGMAYFEAMNISDIAYVTDPGNSYKEMSADAFTIDTIQFPRQTIEYKAGDCDDMTVTYTALLESVGVETGFITVPGHIFSAFKLNMTRADAKRSFVNSDYFIYLDEQVWVPVETTALSEGFIKAWELGAAQWYQHAGEDRAKLFPTRKAWSTYQPVAFEVSDHKLASLDNDELTSQFTEELNNFVDDELAIQQHELLEKLSINQEDTRTLNRLGVLFARYDRNEEAMSYFEQATKEGNYLPALVNMGNMAFLQEDYYSAGSYYQRVINIRPSTATAVLGLARVSHALNDLEKTSELFKNLQALSPELAAQYSFLETGSGENGRESNLLSLGSSMSWDWDN